MGSIAEMQKPHAICIPYPAQGHINPMMKLAKLLHFKGFHISFVNNHYNHKRLLRSRGPSSLDGLPDFRFYSIPDGLPPSDADATQSIPALCESIPKHCLEPFCELITRINDSDVPPLSCIVSDGVMSFTLEAAERFGLPEVLFWTPSACGMLAYTHYRDLVQKGYTPLKDMSYVTNGYLETSLDWISGMSNIRLRDFPSFIRTTDIDDIMLNYFITETAAITRGSAIVLNTFDALEQDSVNPLYALNPRIFTVGPLHLMEQHLQDERVKEIGSSLWKEDVSCIPWLDTKDPGSVVFVNFGSITVMKKEQLTEFGWGLANSKKDFLWITRPDIVGGNHDAAMPPEFLDETKGRGMIVSWCPQEKVLKHPAIGGFLTHSGWNSTLESISSGVPVLCWPFFAEQQTNCRYSCVEWGIGMEIDPLVKRDEVEAQVREMIDGAKGKMMKDKVLELKKKAEEAVIIGGSSYLNFQNLINNVLLRSEVAFPK